MVLVLVDTLRPDALGVYGGFARTAAMDRFANEGMVFENAFTGSFPTVPLRNELYTGRLTYLYKPWAPLGPDETVLAGALSEHGILTGLVTDNYHPYTGGYDYQRGFASWDLVRGQEGDRYRPGPAHLPYPCDPAKLREPERAVEQYLRNIQDRREESDYFCAQTLRRAARWLEDARDEPFFLVVDLFDPHEPWDPPRHYVDLYDPGYTGEEVIYPRYDRADYLTDAQLRHCRALYSGEVTMVDAWFGYFLDRLAALGLDASTRVILMSDHGFYFGEHGYIGKSIIRDGDHEPLPLYPEVARIPVIIRGPGVAPGRSRALCQPVDITATVRAWFGLPPDPRSPGQDLSPLLTGAADAVRRIAVSAPSLITPDSPEPHPAARATVTDGRHLLILGSQRPTRSGHTTRMVDGRARRLASGDAVRPVELYDLEADPHCLANRYAPDAPAARELKAAFFDLMRGQGVGESVIARFEA